MSMSLSKRFNQKQLWNISTLKILSTWVKQLFVILIDHKNQPFQSAYKLIKFIFHNFINYKESEK